MFALFLRLKRGIEIPRKLSKQWLFIFMFTWGLKHRSRCRIHGDMGIEILRPYRKKLHVYMGIEMSIFMSKIGWNTRLLRGIETSILLRLEASMHLRGV